MLLSKSEGQIWNGKLANWLLHLFYLFSQKEGIFPNLKHIYSLKWLKHINVHT